MSFTNIFSSSHPEMIVTSKMHSIQMEASRWGDVKLQEGFPGGGPGPARGGKQKGRDQQGLSIRKGLLQSGRQVK
jgi:hypothetical protein